MKITKKIFKIQFSSTHNFIVTEFPRKWMSFFKTIDSQLPSKFKWINEKGEKFEREEDAYLLLLKNTPKDKNELTDSGKYECVRTLKTGHEDKINVVLHVSGMYDLLGDLK